MQPWHFDDGGIKVPRPRPALGISAFWAIDDTTALNGSTEVIPGSHLWDGQAVEGAVKPADFTSEATPNADRDLGNRPDAVKLTMPSGSLAIAKGTLWHRGGANRSDRPRLINRNIARAGCASLRIWRWLFLPSSRQDCRSAPAN